MKNKDNNIVKILVVLAVALGLFILAVGIVHLYNYYMPGFFVVTTLLLVGVILLILMTSKTIKITREAIVIKVVIGKSIIIAYDELVSIESVRTVSSSGNGIRTEIKNIRFNLKDKPAIVIAETEMAYKKTVKGILKAYDDEILPKGVISKATRELLKNSIK